MLNGDTSSATEDTAADAVVLLNDSYEHQQWCEGSKQAREAFVAPGVSEASQASPQEGRTNSIAETQNTSSQQQNPPIASPPNPFPFPSLVNETTSSLLSPETRSQTSPFLTNQQLSILDDRMDVQFGTAEKHGNNSLHEINFTIHDSIYGNPQKCHYNW